MQVVSFETPKGPKVAIYSKKSYFSEKIISFSYLLLAKSMKFKLKLKNHTIVASVERGLAYIGNCRVVFATENKVLPLSLPISIFLCAQTNKDIHHLDLPLYTNQQRYLPK